MIVVLGVSATAHASTPEELVVEGQQLAAAGEYTRAIQKFKEADAIEPTAEHACLIGLAYTRRELWSQAELFFDRCKERTKAGDPPPAWANEAIETLATKLSSTGIAAIDIRVEPAVGAVAIGVSGFPVDETFAPRTVHLAPGTYVLTATAPGREPVREKVIVTGAAPQAITLSFERHAPVPLPPRPAEKVAHPTSTWFFLGGVGLALLGGGFHVMAALERHELSAAVDARDPQRWDEHDVRFRVGRAGAITGYGLAAVAIAVGFIVRSRETPVVDVAVGRDGGSVALTWRR